MANIMESMTDWMNRRVAPVAQYLGQNKVIQSVSGGMMQTMPITLGMAVVSIIVNLPIPGLSEWMASSGVTAAANEMIGSTMSLLAIYISFLIAYQYAKNDDTNPITAGILSMASFLMLVPSTVTLEDGSTMSAFRSNFLGSDGIFVAIVLSVCVAAAYGWLIRKNIKFNLPDSVPPMVSDSLSPSLTAMIIFVVIFFIKWGFAFTQWGNIFTFITSLISTPLMNVGGSPAALIFMYTLGNILWFFGVHPNAIMSVFIPVLIGTSVANTEAYLAGQPLPNLTFPLLFMCVYFGGQGNTIALCIDMLTAKSERFKAMCKLMLVPNIFNINEPVIFGVPVMLNPLFFVPMVLSSIVPGIIGLTLISILPIQYNPTISLPWVTPTVISALMTSGPLMALVVCACIASVCLLYLPFFKIADQQAYEEEQAMAAQQADE